MSNAWDDMRRAKEESYFDKKNREALERLRAKQGSAPRLSPITGQPMEQLVMGPVVVDRCKDSGGVWLDAGELEALLEARSGEQGEKASDSEEGLLDRFLSGVKGLIP